MCLVYIYIKENNQRLFSINYEIVNKVVHPLKTQNKALFDDVTNYIGSTEQFVIVLF